MNNVKTVVISMKKRKKILEKKESLHDFPMRLCDSQEDKQRVFILVPSKRHLGYGKVVPFQLVIEILQHT